MSPSVWNLPSACSVISLWTESPSLVVSYSLPTLVIPWMAAPCHLSPHRSPWQWRRHPSRSLFSWFLETPTLLSPELSIGPSVSAAGFSFPWHFHIEFTETLTLPPSSQVPKVASLPGGPAPKLAINSFLKWGLSSHPFWARDQDRSCHQVFYCSTGRLLVAGACESTLNGNKW